VAVDRAIAAKDYDTIRQSVAPQYRRSFGNILSASKEYFALMNQTASLIQERLDPAVGQRLRNEAEDTYHALLPSPLQGAVQDGKVQWDLVQMDVKDRSASIQVNNRPTLFQGKYEIVQVKDRWYMAPDESAKQFSADARRMVKTYRQFSKILARLQEKIRKGKVTRQTVAAELWAQ
jgi:hypothetical protein